MKTKNLKVPGALRRVIRSLANVTDLRPRLRAAFSVGLLASAFFLSTACSPTTYDIPSNAYSSSPKGTLSVGDTIRVTYPGAPEFNQTLKIQADGKIGLPMVGNVSASGRTASSLQSSLTAMYESRLNDPTVFVSLDKPAASVYVSGEVGAPGKLLLDRSLTALEAVMEVGGFSKAANPKKVYVIRTEGGNQKRYVLNLANPLSGYESQAFYLRPYDVVYVERSNW
ncbi:MAG: polysaccharide export protein [Armatimonadetes bacterium]|nr:polysaccharide export protein [Akkermansiaceae bacterium]